MQLCAQTMVALFGFAVAIASTWIHPRRRDWRSLPFLIAMVVVAAWSPLISATVAGLVPLVTIAS